jgi:hypothetical protein
LLLGFAHDPSVVERDAFRDCLTHDPLLTEPRELPGYSPEGRFD